MLELTTVAFGSAKILPTVELTFLTAAFRAAKILSRVEIDIPVECSFHSYQSFSTLRADIPVAFSAI